MGFAMRVSNPRGFTLIELLIVVAIIGLLAAIAIPNMLSAQIRSKVAASQQSQRTLGMALELYYVDHTAYPPANYVFPPFGDPSSMTDTWRLTTPISYLAEIPLDLFYKAPEFPPLNTFPGGIYGPAGPYTHLITDKIVTDMWLLWSYGPDGDMEFLQVNYDPTNGTISDGDIYRVGAPR